MNVTETKLPGVLLLEPDVYEDPRGFFTETWNQLRYSNILPANFVQDNLAMEIFEVTKGFPPEERFALTGQIRRSSRSVCLNFREAWAQRRHEARL